MATKHDFHKVIIGRSEALHFVGFDLPNIPARVDTGAYSSSVHASNVILDEKTGVLSFDLLAGHPVCKGIGYHLEATHFKEVAVRSSFGHTEKRFEVPLRVKLGPKVFTARFTLANRSNNLYPILLGRKLLNHRFMVDSSKAGVSQVILKREFKLNREGNK